MKFLRLSFALLFIIPSFSGLAQSYSDIANEKSGNISFQDYPIVGFWIVNEVTVGDEKLTPIAKWFDFQRDGEVSSGNGWVQNSLGQWNYDEDKKEFFQSIEGKADEYGPFNISFQDNLMFWGRKEDGMDVKVSLFRATEKPLAPWDLIVGDWTTDGIGPNPREARFRWDRIFIDTEYKAQRRGVWHIHSHSPELTLYTETDSPDRWQVSFENNQMIWQRLRDGKEEKVIWTKN